jgi:hypothetical protein
LIGSNVEKVTLIAFRPSEYLTEAPAGWLNLFGTSVHSMAVQLVLLVLGWWREEHIPSHSFDYFMESGDSDEGKVLETVKKMQLDPPTRKVIGVKTFSSIEKGSARGLEAADFWAWQWNKYYVDRVLKGTPDEPRRDFKAAVSVQKSCR